MDNPIKNIIIQQQKALQTKKYINKRNISGLRKIPSTSICQNSNINRTLNNCSKLRIQLDDRKKKLISLKILKNKILNGNENQNLNCDTNINKKHGMNTMLNNYLTHKSTYSEMNSVFIYNNSTSNCNTTCNTHTNSNNKNNSFNNKSIFKKISKNVKGVKLNTSKIKEIIAKKNLEKNKLKENRVSPDKENPNQIETKNENYIKNVEEYMDDILGNILEEERNSEIKITNSYFKFQTDINSKMRDILIDCLIDVNLKLLTPICP